MRLETAFRLSLYLCLSVASLCLAYAEQVYLPGFFFVGIGFVALLLTVFFLEDRWTLSLAGANLMGLFIAIAAGGWLAYHFLHPARELAGIVSGPVANLPFVGPVLMMLVAAKLLRPKNVDDFWALHCLGILEVVLACVLAGQPVVCVFLGIYLACFVGSLSLFSLYSGVVRAQTYRPRATSPERDPGPGPISSRLGLMRPAGWAALIVPLGFVVFLATPQRNGAHWNPGLLGGHQNHAIPTGLSSTIDLNRTGTLTIDDRVAFEVDVRQPDGSPLVNLDPNQRWRGPTLDFYENGHWTNRALADVVEHDIRTELRPGTLPDIGPHLTFRYTLDSRSLNRPVLADPLQVLGRGGQLPVAFALDGQWWVGVTVGFQEGEFFHVSLDEDTKYQYVQQLIPADPDLSPSLLDEYNLGAYTQQPILGIRAEAMAIGKALVASHQLEASDLDLVPATEMPRLVMPTFGPRGSRMPVVIPATPVDQGPAKILKPENRVKVAQAFCNYLSRSGVYTYSLAQRHSDLALDPTADFLVNVKDGHCERFAAALALLLRSYGIPSRILLGFLGQEETGAGHYVIRQSRAHSWVQVLITINPPGKPRRYAWLALDPTPAGATDVVGETSYSSWRRLELFFTDLWRSYVLDYDADRQRSAASALYKHLTPGELLLPVFPMTGGDPKDAWSWVRLTIWLMIVAGLVWVGLRVVRRRRQREAPAGASLVTFYTRLLHTLKQRAQLKPAAGQTPREFATSAGAVLRETGHPALAEAVHELIARFYSLRYGGKSVGAEEARAIDERLTEIDTGLQVRGHLPPP